MQMQIFDTMTQEYLQATQTWFSQVQTEGMHLMVILVLIQFTLKISKNILSGDGNLTGMLVNTVKHLTIISILYYLITNAGTLLPEMFNSFSQLGIAGSSITSLDPSSVVSEGLSIASGILQSFNQLGVLKEITFGLFGVFCSAVIVICYGLIAADLMITLIESYFLVAVSSLFIAFGSTSYTLPMAREYLGMTVGVGIKLMMMYVMIAVGANLGADWAALIVQAAQNNDWTTYLGVSVGSIIYYLIVKHVPARIASAASQAFAISHMGDAQAAAVGAITNTASAATHMFSAAKTATGFAMGGVSKVGDLVGKMFSGGSGGGLDSGMGSQPLALGQEKSGLGQAMISHFGGSEPGSQGDLFATTNENK